MTWTPDIPVQEDPTFMHPVQDVCEYWYLEPVTYHGFTVMFSAHTEFEDVLTGMDEACSRRDLRGMRDMREMVACGARVWFVAIVNVWRKMPVYPWAARGEAVLGCCLYESYEAFHTKYRDDYYMDLVNEAVEEAAVNQAKIETSTSTYVNQQMTFESKVLPGVCSDGLKLRSKW